MRGIRCTPPFNHFLWPEPRQIDYTKNSTPQSKPAKIDRDGAIPRVGNNLDFTVLAVYKRLPHSLFKGKL